MKYSLQNRSVQLHHILAALPTPAIMENLYSMLLGLHGGFELPDGRAGPRTRWMQRLRLASCGVGSVTWVSEIFPNLYLGDSPPITSSYLPHAAAVTTIKTSETLSGVGGKCGCRKDGAFHEDVCCSSRSASHG